MPNSVFSVPGPLVTPPLGAVGHKRATLTASDQLLSTAVNGSAGNFPHSNDGQYPMSVSLQVESADAGALVFVTMDGTATPASATNGFQVPIAPSLPIRIPYPDGLRNAGTIRVFATGVAHLQCFFEYAVG